MMNKNRIEILESQALKDIRRERENDKFNKIPILGWLSKWIEESDEEYHVECIVGAKAFDYGDRVKNKIGKKGSINDLITHGYGPIYAGGYFPHWEVKFDDGSTKKYRYKELEILHE